MSFLTDRLKKVASPSKHGFDLPERHLFSCKVGQLLPVLCKPMVLGDKFDINVIESTQTVPFNKAAFFRCKKYYHFWFVPYSYLWNQFDSFYTQRENPYSANSKGSTYLPCASYHHLLLNCGFHGGSYLTSIDEYGVLNFRNRLRLLDLLRYGNWQDVMKNTDNLDFAEKCYQYFRTNPKYVNIFSLAAYQYIWNFAYRNKYFDTIIDPTEFNLDDLDCTTLANSQAQDVRLRKFMKLRYRQWDHDMFTGLLPSSQYGSVESIELPKLGTENNTFVELRDTNGSETVAEGANAVNYNRPSSGSNQMFGGLVANDSGVTFKYAEVTGKIFDILQLRKAEAMQKWRETTMRNGRDANDQYLGHFGMKSKHATDHHPIYVGGFDSRIVVDQVTATSNTQGVDGDGQQNIGSVLGQLAGKGVSLSENHHIKFSAPDHGLLMCLFSIVPEADYDASGLDPQHTMLEPFDFFTPELENLGFEPVRASELSIKPVTIMPTQIYGGERGNDLTDIPTGFDPNNVLGYLPRYHQYKTSVDLLHGEFASGMSLESMAVPRADINMSLYDYQQGGTPQAPTYEATYQGMRTKTFYIDPGCCDHLFPLSADSNENTDQFYNLVKFDIKAVRPMSVLGLPY